MDILSLLGERPIAYHKPLIRRFGLAPGVFLGQLLYWHGKGGEDGWIYKTQKEMEEETCLSRRSQETARKALTEAGVLEEELRGIPAQLYYRVKMTELAKSLDISSLAEPSKLDCTNPPNSDVRTRQTNTKNTQETTTRNLGAAAPPEVSPPSVPPQIELVRELTRRYPPKELWPRLIETLGQNPAKHRLTQCWEEWRLRGFKPTNFHWLTEWYVRGIPPSNGHHLPTQAEMNAGGRGKLVL